MAAATPDRRPGETPDWIETLRPGRAMFAYGVGTAASVGALALPVDYAASGWELGTAWISPRLGWHNFAAGIALWGALVLPVVGLGLRVVGQRRSALAAGVLAWLSAFAIAPFLSFGANGFSGLRLGILVLLAGETAALVAFLVWVRAPTHDRESAWRQLRRTRRLDRVLAGGREPTVRQSWAR